MVTEQYEGVAVFEALQAALGGAKGNLSECQVVAAELDGQMKELLSRRGEALLKLARLFLPEVSRPAIESTFEGIRGDLLTILARQEAKLEELQGEGRRAGEEIGRLDAEIDGVTHRLDEKVALRERLESAVTEALKADPDFKARSGLALQAEERLHRDEERASDMAREAAEKLPGYRRSRLFCYLYDRGFGTAEYRGVGWTRSIDRRVARLIDFSNARNGREFLSKTPELVASEVARRRDRFAELMQQIEAIQRAEADKLGLTAVLQEGEALGADRDRLVGESDRLRRRAQEVQHDLAALERSQNQFHNQAIERFRAFLGQTKLALLAQRAGQTPGPEDDEVVAEVARLDLQIDGLAPRLAELGRRREAAERTHEGLESVIRRYRQANFDSRRSFFDDALDFRRVCAQFEGGTLDAEGFWRAMRTSQRFRPSWAEQGVTGAGRAIASPSGRMLLGAILDVAAASMHAAAHRGVRRRGDENPSPSPPPGPSRRPSGPTASPGRSGSSSGGGFTSGEGF